MTGWAKATIDYETDEFDLKMDTECQEMSHYRIELQDDPASLYSCILVSVLILILWEYITYGTFSSTYTLLE